MGLCGRVLGCLAVVVPVALGCSSKTADSHEPFASATCSKPPCGATTVVSGGGPGEGTTSDAGVIFLDSGIAANSGCSVDPTSQIRLCLSSAACPGFSLDAVAFSGCGFVVSSANIDVECFCNGSLLCPIGAQTTCAAVKSLIVQSPTGQDVCNMAVSNGTCKDLGGAPATGMGGASSGCDQVCAASCSNSPSCLVRCGC